MQTGLSTGQLSNPEENPRTRWEERRRDLDRRRIHDQQRQWTEERRRQWEDRRKRDGDGRCGCPRRREERMQELREGSQEEFQLYLEEYSAECELRRSTRHIQLPSDRIQVTQRELEALDRDVLANRPEAADPEERHQLLQSLESEAQRRLRTGQQLTMTRSECQAAVDQASNALDLLHPLDDRDEYERLQALIGTLSLNLARGADEDRRLALERGQIGRQRELAQTSPAAGRPFWETLAAHG
ncbi:MAG: hypothetical protein AB1758_29070 [Candidatus Eremiobacterota bacterium]